MMMMNKNKEDDEYTARRKVGGFRLMIRVSKYKVLGREN